MYARIIGITEKQKTIADNFISQFNFLPLLNIIKMPFHKFLTKCYCQVAEFGYISCKISIILDLNSHDFIHAQGVLVTEYNITLGSFYTFL